MKTLAIVGSGDLGKQIAHFALKDKIYSKVCFIDDFCKEKEVAGKEVIGKVEDIIDLYKKNKFDELIIGIGYKHLNKKREIFESYINIVPFGKIIHSSCIVDTTVIIKKGSVLYPGSIIDANVIVEENCLVNIGCTIAHDTIIGKHSFLSPKVALAGFVQVGEMCILGINSTIIDNIVIKGETQLGAGTVVIKGITRKGLYVGNPSRFIR